MKTWFSILIISVLLSVSESPVWANTAFALGYCLEYPEMPLTVGCNDTSALPTGTMVYIYRDIDLDGPDETDPLLRVQTSPEGVTPNSITYQSATRNRFAVNEDSSLADGFFYESFGYDAGLPEPPMLFYLRIFCEDGGLLWESSVNTFLPLTYSEAIYSFYDWTCYDCEPFDFCDPSPIIELDYSDGLPQQSCGFLCDGYNSWIAVRGISETTQWPVIEIEGVDSETCQEFECVPAVNPHFVGEMWGPGNIGIEFKFTDVGTDSSGCAIFTLTHMHGAELDTFYGYYQTDGINVMWSTLRESDLSTYELYQNSPGQRILIATIDATNTDSLHNYHFLDTQIVPGIHYGYILHAQFAATDAYQWFGGRTVYPDPIETDDQSIAIIQDYALYQNYPNPFNPSTSIAFELPQASEVLLKVYDVNGREVAILLNQTMSAGSHAAEFRAEALPSGVYFYQLTAGAFTDTKKMLLLK